MNLKFKDRDKDLISKYETIALCGTSCAIFDIRVPVIHENGCRKTNLRQPLLIVLCL